MLADDGEELVQRVVRVYGDGFAAQILQLNLHYWNDASEVYAQNPSRLDIRQGPFLINLRIAGSNGLRYKYQLYFCITIGETLLEEERKVGPKGQFVIPRAMRKALKIEPGSKIVVRLEDDKIVVKKPFFDAVAVFRRIAKSGKSISKIDSDANYEEELEERSRRCSI